ncbi:MAG TPA: DoxX family protein [Polyangia bacterium]
MNLGLWIVQGLLAAAFMMAGLMKATQPIDKLAQRMQYVTRFPSWVTRFIGVSELAGGLGLVLPWATGVMPVLTPIAAAALALVMVLAAIHHLRHNEAKMAPINVVLGGLALFVAWGRWH